MDSRNETIAKKEFNDAPFYVYKGWIYMYVEFDDDGVPRTGGRNDKRQLQLSL